MKSLSKLVLATVLSIASYNVALAQDANQKAPAAAAGAEASSAMTEGEVRKVDKSTGKITIKHGPLKNLDMPAMTMVFRARDKAMLGKVNTGDKIRFVAEKKGGAFVVTQLEPGN